MQIEDADAASYPARIKERMRPRTPFIIACHSGSNSGENLMRA
jgi:hypothetical protein